MDGSMTSASTSKERFEPRASSETAPDARIQYEDEHEHEHEEPQRLRRVPRLRYSAHAAPLLP